MRYFYKFSDYLKDRFGGKVWKVPVNAGFSCPNRDGLKGTDGCIYCSVASFDGAEDGTIREQVQERAARLRKRNIDKFIVYFQSYSNTYGDLEMIKKRVEASLVDDGIVAIHIGTRPDVIDSEKLEYFRSLNEKYEVVLEYGLQSASDHTLRVIKRGHDAQEFIDAVKLTHEYGLKTCAHIIFGLPGDSREDMFKSVKLVSSLGMHSVKFHHLHVVKDTTLATMYRQGLVNVFEADEYIELLAEGLTHLDKDIVVARLSGDAAGDTLIAPVWDISKGELEQKLIDKLKENGDFQGSSLV